jgi:hypothetical protein
VNESAPREHKLTPFALVEGTRITYPKIGGDTHMTLMSELPE